MAQTVKSYRHVIYIMSNPCPDEDELRAMRMHPDAYFKSIGLEYENAQPNSFQECWHLYGVTGLPDPTPPWFRIAEE